MRKSVEEEVSIRLITQATTATFSDLYFRLTFLFFIQAGSKRVLSATQGEVVGEEGDVLIFPPGAVVTMENRPMMEKSYRAVGVSFTDALVEAVFADVRKPGAPPDIQIVRANPKGPMPENQKPENPKPENPIPENPMEILPIIRATLADPALPPAIRRHRLLEPLVWLREAGIVLPTHGEELPLSKVRRVIESDLGHEWRAPEVADRLAMSEATMRRWLSKTGQQFSKILLNTRLEQGLGLLQTTDLPISAIALDCGFKTPSHFSEAFKKRFHIRPKEIRTKEMQRSEIERSEMQAGET